MYESLWNQTKFRVEVRRKTDAGRWAIDRPPKLMHMHKLHKLSWFMHATGVSLCIASFDAVYCSKTHCFAWKIPSSEICIMSVLFESASHFRIEKYDSTEVVFSKTVASRPQNMHSRIYLPGATSQASSKVVLTSCSSMAQRTMGPVL